MSPATTTNTASTPVKRACDSCHRRKVKCIGEGTKPCKNCISAGLTCTYNAIPQKKGPKGSRAKVLSELRETQRQSRLISGLQNEYHFEGRNISPAWTKTPGLLSPEVVNGCVDYFFTHLYPSQPILHRQRTQQIVANMDHSVEAYCMVVSLCAYMMIQPNMILPTGIALSAEFGQLSNTTYGHLLLDEVVRVRKSYNYIESPTTMSIITSFFLFGSYFCLDRQNTAWFCLREATTHALVLGMHDEETYKTGDAIETSRRRRLYWLLFVTERAYALRKHRPLTLHATIQLPTVDEDPTENVHISGFVHLVNLYRPFDDTFIGLWNKVRTGCLPSWLSQLQSQLTEALPTYLESTEVQAVDLHTSQQWLKTMVWQLGISHGFVSNIASYNNTMNWNYPIEISRDLITMSSQFSQQAMEVHGVGLIEKLFDVACTLTDVMSCVPLDPNPFELGPRDYLHRFLTLISTLRGGQSRYLPLLMSKINETLPAAQLGIPSTTPSSFSSTGPHHAAAHHQPQTHTQAHHHQHHSRPPGSDMYDSSTVAGSAPGSHEATPFDSPPHMSIPLRPAHSYGDLKQTSLHATPHSAHAQIPPPYNASPGGPHASYSGGGYSNNGSAGSMTAYPDPVSMTTVGGVTSAQSPAIVLHDLYGLSRPHGDFGE